MVDEKDLALFPTLMQTWPWLCHFFHMNEDEDMRIWVFVHSTHHSKIEWSVQIPGLPVLYFYMCWSISIGFSTKMLGLDGCVGYLWLEDSWAPLRTSAQPHANASVMPSSARNSPSQTAFATADDDTPDRVQDDSSNDQDGADTP
jgi:hypothetical protein